ncbi:MAG: acetate--CoA ligase family protein, partial [Sulfurimicrobium sp.]|nr:acetate--CoA ligase family protein [Sulfurimicrobium sp.]
MNLHEYQAKQLLRDQGIPTPRGVVLDEAAQTETVAGQLGGDAWVVKAQIHAGGRGKAGGVRVVRSLNDLTQSVSALLGSRLVTYQNAPDGQMVTRLLIEETLDIAREIYLSLTVDRESERIVLVASGSGGMEIEEIARTDPDKILREVCDPVWGLQDFQCRNIAFGLNLQGAQIAAFSKMAKGLFHLFMKNDLSLVEINPLVVTGGGELVALDCKISVEDNALYRQKDLAA